MLKLPAELAITQIETIHQQLQQELDEHNDICLDISEVIKADTASVQLLCALQQNLKTTGHEIMWIGDSEALEEAITALGLIDFMSLKNSA